MKKLLLPFVLITGLFCISLQAQFQFNQHYDYLGKGAMTSKTMIPVEDGGFLLLGEEETSTAGLQIKVVRIDDQKNEIWSNLYGGGAYDFAQDALVWDDGTIWLVGYTTSFGMGRREGYVLHISENGKLLEEFTYGSVQDDALTIIDKMDDDRLLLAGLTYAGGDAQSWILHIDTKGNILEEATFGERGAESLWDHVKIEDGWILVGQTTSNSAGSKDAYWVKLDNSGQLIWEKQYGTAADERMFSIAKGEKGFAMAGWSDDFSERQGYLIFLDEELNFDWDLEVDEGSLTDLQGVVYQDGTYLAGGYTTDLINGGDALLVAVSEGKRIANTWIHDSRENEEVFDIAVQGDGVNLLGHVEGLISPSFRIFEWKEMMTSNRVLHDIPIDVFPNPAQDKVNVVYPENRYCDGWILSSVDGVELEGGFGKLSEFDVSGLPSGLYLLNLCHKVIKIQVTHH